MDALEDLGRIAASRPIPEKQDSLLVKYDIPISHLDFDYVKNCEDGKKLERILQILRSGEEGHYPDLIKATEERLEAVKPKSKYLRKCTVIKNRQSLSKDELTEIDDDLNDFLKKISKSNMELESRKVRVPVVDDVPSVREKTNESYRQEMLKDEKNNRRRIKATDYDQWDRYDPDTELLKMDLEEEKMKKEALAKQKEEKKKELTVEKRKKTVTFNKFATEAEASFEANREREKGNEYFKSGEFSLALDSYSKSIAYKPSVAGFNNRAIACIKLKMYKQALEDCQRALAIEPENLKALIRKAVALKELQRYDEALDVVERGIFIDPNDVTAQDLAYKLRQITGEKLMNRKMIIEEIEG